MSTSIQYIRQSFLGQGSEHKFQKLKLGVIGLCGGGSHICQQAAHVGIRNFVVVDFDTVDIPNLNRMIGSQPEDAEISRLKVDVMERMILAIQPGANVEKCNGAWQGFTQTLLDCDVIIGCIDTYEARDQLERFCRRFLIPYIDIGMDVYNSAYVFSISGQVITSLPGGPCMRCLGLITDARLAVEQEKYGAAGGKPQVVWPNGVLASVAVGRAIALITPWSQNMPLSPLIEYDGNRNVLQDGNRLKYLQDRPCEHFTYLGGLGNPTFKL